MALVLGGLLSLARNFLFGRLLQIRNERIKHNIGQKKTLVNTKWYGHVKRMGEKAKQVYEMRVEDLDVSGPVLRGEIGLKKCGRNEMKMTNEEGCLSFQAEDSLKSMKIYRFRTHCLKFSGGL